MKWGGGGETLPVGLRRRLLPLTKSSHASGPPAPPSPAIRCKQGRPRRLRAPLWGGRYNGRSVCPGARRRSGRGRPPMVALRLAGVADGAAAAVQRVADRDGVAHRAGAVQMGHPRALPRLAGDAGLPRPVPADAAVFLRRTRTGRQRVALDDARGHGNLGAHRRLHVRARRRALGHIALPGRVLRVRLHRYGPLLARHGALLGRALRHGLPRAGPARHQAAHLGGRPGGLADRGRGQPAHLRALQPGIRGAGRLRAVVSAAGAGHGEAPRRGRSRGQGQVPADHVPRDANPPQRRHRHVHPPPRLAPQRGAARDGQHHARFLQPAPRPHQRRPRLRQDRGRQGGPRGDARGRADGGQGGPGDDRCPPRRGGQGALGRPGHGPRSADRPDAAAADPGQPRQQRRQVHRIGLRPHLRGRMRRPLLFGPPHPPRTALPIPQRTLDRRLPAHPAPRRAARRVPGGGQRHRHPPLARAQPLPEPLLAGRRPHHAQVRRHRARADHHGAAGGAARRAGGGAKRRGTGDRVRGVPAAAVRGGGGRGKGGGARGGREVGERGVGVLHGRGGEVWRERGVGERVESWGREEHVGCGRERRVEEEGEAKGRGGADPRRRGQRDQRPRFGEAPRATGVPRRVARRRRPPRRLGGAGRRRLRHPLRPGAHGPLHARAGRHRSRAGDPPPGPVGAAAHPGVHGQRDGRGRGGMPRGGYGRARAQADTGGGAAEEDGGGAG